MALHDIMVHAYGLAASTQISYLSVQATQLGNTALSSLLNEQRSFYC
jgi:hypothetical protein